MDVDEQLIEEVRSREILYDLSQEDYKNLKKKEFAWRAVAAAVKMGEEDCKKRWKGLRDSYKRCKRAEQLPSGSAAKKPNKCWKHFEAMSFLDNVTSSRNTIGNIGFALPEEYTEETPDESSDEFVSHSSFSARAQKKNDSQKFHNFLDFAATNIAESCRAAKAKKEDPTDLFFLGLAAKVKAANMPPTVLNKIEAKLAASVFNEIDHFLADQQ